MARHIFRRVVGHGVISILVGVLVCGDATDVPEVRLSFGPE